MRAVAFIGSMVACARNGTRYSASTTFAAPCRASPPLPRRDTLRRSSRRRAQRRSRRRSCRSSQRRLPRILNFGVERAHAFERAPVAIGDDRNRVVELHDFLHAGHRFRGAVSTDASFAPNTGDAATVAYSILRQRHVDAVGRRAVDLRRDVDARRRLADDRVVVARLERRMHRRFEQRRLGARARRT